MIDIPYLIRDLIRCRFDFQIWANRRYSDHSMCIIPKSSVQYIQTKDGLKWVPESLEEIDHVYTEYDLGMIAPDDIVLDLGANVGGYALRASRIAKHVYAVEPLFFEELQENIRLNGLWDKVTVIREAIGEPEPIHLVYRDRGLTYVPLTLTEIRKMCPGVTLLKIDIEGSEWTIKPEELADIQKIEFEVHFWKGGRYPVNYELLEYIRTNWHTTETHLSPEWCSFYIHGSKRKDRRTRFQTFIPSPML